MAASLGSSASVSALSLLSKVSLLLLSSSLMLVFHCNYYYYVTNFPNRRSSIFHTHRRMSTERPRKLSSILFLLSAPNKDNIFNLLAGFGSALYKAIRVLKHKLERMVA